jgi:CheY-like chemotaxis protein/signal transduction histidine kinase
MMAEQCNHMAESLKRLSDERDHRDWINAGEAGLALELRGDLEPQEVASRAVRFLARYLDAPGAALYYANRERALVLLGQYALGPTGVTTELPPRFRLGEGLVGQAALHDDMMVLPDPPPDYLRVRSGLGESAPRALVLLPLVHAGKVTGVLELAMFKPWSDLSSELVMAVRETVAIALEVATARASLRDLLLETQQQAQRLVTQEEELRAANEELQGQQEQLRMSNDQMRDRGIQLEEQRRTLEDRNADLLQVRHRLEQKAIELTTVSTYKSQFLANMSHELRTPLNSMLLLSNLLMQNESGNLTEKQVEFCRTINGAGKDLLALINQVLDLAKIESGKQTTNIEPVPLRPLAERCEQVFGPLARDKGLALLVEVAPDVPESIATDRQRLDQILNNLIGNAIKFTHHGQVALRISAAPPEAVQKVKRSDLTSGRTLMLSVSDTGIGIPAEHRERVFQPFEQVDGKSDRRYGGTGLGLPIARELANLLGGELQLESEVGRGSTFVCYLPYETKIVSPEVPTPSLSAGPPTPRPQPAHDDGATLEPNEPYLLIIEDDPTFADTFGDVIREQNLKFLIASDGMTGLRLAREKKPSGIILDVRLPDLDGWTVMERLRADPATASIPVHFVSAAEAGERGMAMGAVGYVTKPTSKRDLLRVIQALTPSPSERPCRILVVEDDQDLADSLVQRFAGENLEVARVASARAAFEALRNARYDCMVLDLSLPDMDGLDLLESLQKWGAGEAPPVLVYTGRALSRAEAKRLEAYAEAVVLKEGPSADRLIDEVRLFVGRLKGGVPSRRVAKHLHPKDVSLAGRRVLVVDDDMRTVYALSALLRAKGVEVLVADTGLAALSTLLQHPDVEAVLMDIMMPEMDGYEAMRRIRQQERFRDLPVIALTAKAMKGDRAQCIEAGATDYLSKPIDADRLLEMLNTRLSARPDHGNGKRS